MWQAMAAEACAPGSYEGIRIDSGTRLGWGTKCGMPFESRALILQVGIVRESEGRLFRVLSTDEVEEHLTAISERD